MASDRDSVRHAAGRGREGFTLLEVSITLLILVLMLAVTAPAATRAGTPARDCVRRVEAALHRLRRTAAYDARRVVLVSTPERIAEPGLGHEPALPACGEGVKVRIADNGRGGLGFDAVGRAYGGPVLVEVRGRLAATIEVDPWTGSIHVAE